MKAICCDCKVEKEKRPAISRSGVPIFKDEFGKSWTAQRCGVCTLALRKKQEAERKAKPNYGRLAHLNGAGWLKRQGVKK